MLRDLVCLVECLRSARLDSMHLASEASLYDLRVLLDVSSFFFSLALGRRSLSALTTEVTLRCAVTSHVRQSALLFLLLLCPAPPRLSIVEG